MKIAILFAALLISGCTEAFRAPSVYHHEGDVITGYSLAFFDASCRAEGGGPPRDAAKGTRRFQEKLVNSAP